jgi:S-DNA-T family DNA segregation ATPase FtsK/SpoIIIE
MFEQRSLKLDLVALALAAVAMFLGLSLFSYNPADPPSTLVYPAAQHTSNACGRAGALVADLALQGLGLGAYYLLISLAVADVLLLARRPIGDLFVRGIGWVFSLVGLTTLVAMALPQFAPGPVIGTGGYLGAAGRGLLEMHFATVGAYLLAVSLLACGLLLCTDYVLLRMLLATIRTPLAVAGSARQALFRGTTAKAKHANAASPKSAAAAAEGDAGERGLSVRIRGKTTDDLTPASLEKLATSAEAAILPAAATAAAAEEDEDEAEEAEAAGPSDEAATDADAADEATDADSQEAPAKPGVGKRLANALRIKNPNKKKDEREEVMEELDAASRGSDSRPYELPNIDLLLPGETISYEEHEKDVRRKAKILEKTFLDFGFRVKVVEVETGPVIAQFEVELEAGLRLSKITSLADDLAIALRVPSVRIVAPIPGKNTVGIEVPNAERQLVRLREVIEEANGKAGKMRIPIFLGKDVSGKSMVVDLSSLPHLLIAGRTGTGKSVCLNSIIVSMLMSRRPDEVRMLMIDPKMVELSPYKTLPHLMHPVVTDMRKAEAILAWAVEKMEERYSLLARAGVRHISVFNQLGEDELMDRLQPESDDERKNIPTNLPYIVIIADEIADLMMTAGKEVEQHIIRLAQKSRAVGIHLVLATQKPTVDVITGLIKSNLPARIAFQVASRTDSRVVLDEMGADKLLGNGDMLFLWPGTSTLLRGQGTYVSDDEINRVVDCVGTTEQQFVKELVQLKASNSEEGAPAGKLPNRDELYEAAVDIVVREGRGSCSLLQRALGIGYGRAARLVDFMAEDGIVGQYNGSQARDVLLTVEQWEQMSGGAPAGPAASAAEPQRNRRVLSLTPREESPAESRPRGEEGDSDGADEEQDESFEDETADDAEEEDALAENEHDPTELDDPLDQEHEEQEDDDEIEAVEPAPAEPPRTPKRRSAKSPGAYQAESA